jgi:hypothetical protein
MLVPFEELTADGSSSGQNQEVKPGKQSPFRNLMDPEPNLDSLQTTIKDTISQTINMFKYPDGDVRQEAVTLFGQLAHQGEQLMSRSGKC